MNGCCCFLVPWQLTFAIICANTCEHMLNYQNQHCGSNEAFCSLQAFQNPESKTANANFPANWICTMSWCSALLTFATTREPRTFSSTTGSSISILKSSEAEQGNLISTVPADSLEQELCHSKRQWKVQAFANGATAAWDLN